MTDMNNFDDEFLRIKGLRNTSLIAKELKNKSIEFREAYQKKSKKLRNDKYQGHAKDRLNKLRREKRKQKKEEGLLEFEKPIIHIAPPLNIEEVDTSVKRNYADNKKLKNLTESTIKTYGDTIKALYNKYHNTPMPNDAEILKYLRWEKHNPTKLYKQNEYIIKNIKDIAENHSTKLPQLNGIFSRFNTKRLRQFREAIHPYSIAFQRHYQEHRNDLDVNEEQISKISFEKEDILANAEKIEPVKQKILYMLMFMMPTRRINEYGNTLIANNEDETKKEEHNWYYNNKIYINNTKNKNKIVLDIPDEISSIINENINEFSTKYLLNKVSQSTLSTAFANLMYDIYGCRFTATNIRKLYATYNIKKGLETGDIKKMIKNQFDMGHSLAEHLKYSIPNTSSN